MYLESLSLQFKFCYTREGREGVVQKGLREERRKENNEIRGNLGRKGGRKELRKKGNNNYMSFIMKFLEN